MPLFRKHRGSLERSLETTVIVNNVDHLKEIIFEDFKKWISPTRQDGSIFSKEIITLKVEPYYGELDKRCGWYTQIVSADVESKHVFHVMGFLSEPFQKNIISNELYRHVLLNKGK